MRRVLAACLVFVGLLPATATAEWHFTPLIGLAFKGATNINDIEQGAEETHKNFGGAVALLGSGIFGVEGIVTWTPGFFENDDSPFQGAVAESRAISLMGNVVLTTPRNLTEYGLRPYFSGGAGLMHSMVTQIASPGGDEGPLPTVRLNAPGFNLGVGAIGFFTERTGVRFDFRYHSTFRRSADLLSADPGSLYLRYMTASVGVVWRRR